MSRPTAPKSIVCLSQDNQAVCLNSDNSTSTVLNSCFIDSDDLTTFEVSNDGLIWFTVVRATNPQFCQLNLRGVTHIKKRGTGSITIFMDHELVSFPSSSARQPPCTGTEDCYSSEEESVSSVSVSSSDNNEGPKSILKKGLSIKKGLKASHKRNVSFNPTVEKSLGDGLVFRITKPGDASRTTLSKQVDLLIDGKPFIGNVDKLCQGLVLATADMNHHEHRFITVPPALDIPNGPGKYLVINQGHRRLR